MPRRPGPDGKQTLSGGTGRAGPARYTFDRALRGGLAFKVVEPLTEQEIRAAFVNCSKGEAKRLHVPRELAGQPWTDLDFLGWRDPQAPDRAYLVADLGVGPVPASWPSRFAARPPGRSAATCAPSA